MRKPRSSNRSNLALHKQEYEHNLAQIAKIQARNEALAKVITEEENTEIVALIRSYPVTLENLQRVMEGLRKGEVPFPMNENREANEEDRTYESHD